MNFNYLISIWNPKILLSLNQAQVQVTLTQFSYIQTLNIKQKTLKELFLELILV